MCGRRVELSRVTQCREGVQFLAGGEKPPEEGMCCGEGERSHLNVFLCFRKLWGSFSIIHQCVMEKEPSGKCSEENEREALEPCGCSQDGK